MVARRQRSAAAWFALIAFALMGFFLQFRRAADAGRRRLSQYPARSVDLSFGRTTFVDAGDPGGEPVLAMHGMFGGFDQGYDIVRNHDYGYRIVAPSRFGYPGSDVRGGGTPADQAAANVELLDHLVIDTVFVLGASGGGTAAIRFALDHPERTKGLILVSSAMPYPEKPRDVPEYAGPPEFLCNAPALYLFSPFFPVAMSMPRSTIHTMFPVAERRRGVLLDASVANPDMARNFEEYPIETLQVPVLVLQAKDDALVKYERAVEALPRFSQVDFVPFESGGHLRVGHAADVTRAIADFIRPGDRRG